MEENVALDSKKQRKFVKSIKGIKKLIKKNEGKAQIQKKDEEKIEPTKPFSMKIKNGRISKKKKRKERGLVYLSHIPHGFYEHQMTQYFKQFGVVTNARVIRSKRTGNSKGFAFVEFREPAVGQIVAETMNNYLMGKRLIKAAYIPPEKQKHAFRKHWNNVNNPGSQLRLKMKKAFNADKDENGELKRARKLLSNLNKNKKKLSELGINYDFFAPVDVPEALLDQIVKKEKEENTVKEDRKPKKEKNGKEKQTENTKVAKNEKPQNVKQSNEPKGKNNNKNEKENKPAAEVNNKKGKPVEAKKETAPKGNKKEQIPIKVDEKQQKLKEQQLKTAGVKPAEEFIKLGQNSGDESDSSYDFDSDEYEKMMQEDNSDLPSGEESDDESSDDDDGDDGEEDEESDDEEVPPKKAKVKSAPKVIQPVQTKKQVQKQKSQAKQQPQAKKQQPQVLKQQPQAKKQQPQVPKQQLQAQKQQPQALKQKPQKPQAKQQEQKKPVDAKRKAPQKSAVSPKKPKFEKQSQKPLKKQFKKK